MKKLTLLASLVLLSLSLAGCFYVVDDTVYRRYPRPEGQPAQKYERSEREAPAAKSDSADSNAPATEERVVYRRVVYEPTVSWSWWYGCDPYWYGDSCCRPYWYSRCRPSYYWWYSRCR